MTKVRENACRRHARRLGLRLQKSRARLWSVDNQLGYMLSDADLNTVIAGGKFDLDLEDVEEWLAEYETDLRREVTDE
jgi:hypothetical protein